MKFLDIFREPEPEPTFKPYNVWEALRGENTPPGIIVPSAEGITTYPGFGDDEESRRARAYLESRLAELSLRYPSSATDKVRL